MRENDATRILLKIERKNIMELTWSNKTLRQKLLRELGRVEGILTLCDVVGMRATIYNSFSREQIIHDNAEKHIS